MIKKLMYEMLFVAILHFARNIEAVIISYGIPLKDFVKISSRNLVLVSLFFL